MKIAIFGATGKTGQHLVQQALDADYEVAALVRNPAKLTLQHDHLKVIQGDVLNDAAIETVIKNAEAVISVLGPSSNKPEYLISQGTDKILTAMKRHNVQRLIISAGAGVRDPQDKIGVMDKVIGGLLHLVSKNVVEDMKQVVEKVRQSDREWTIVRVPMLTDDEKQNSLRVGYLGQGVGIRLARADMAAFMLKQLQDTAHLRQAPVISN
jgi:putative NADH-flavin reductase